MAPPHLSASAAAFLATAALSLLAADAAPVVVVVFDGIAHPYNHTVYNGTSFPDAPRDALILGYTTGTGFVAPSPTESFWWAPWTVLPPPGYLANLFTPSPPSPPTPLPKRSPKDRKRGNGPRAPRHAPSATASPPPSAVASPASGVGPPSSPPSTTPTTPGPQPPPPPSPPPAPTPAAPPAPETAPEPAAPPPPAPEGAPEPDPGGGGPGGGGDDPGGDDDNDGLLGLGLDPKKLSKGLLKLSEKVCKYWGQGKEEEKAKIKKLKARLKKLDKKLKARLKRQPTATYYFNQYCGSPPVPTENE